VKTGIANSELSERSTCLVYYLLMYTNINAQTIKLKAFSFLNKRIDVANYKLLICFYFLYEVRVVFQPTY